MFNTITLKQLAVKDSTKLGEGKYISNGIFVTTINIRYSTLFDSPTTSPHILGVEFVIKTDKRGIPYIVSKRIVNISYDAGEYITDEMVDITEELVGDALFEALDYNYATDEFTFSMEALANADNVIRSVNFEFVFDYKTYVLSFNAGLYQAGSFDSAGKIEPIDPESITDYSTVYYLVKYNDRKWTNTWIPCDENGEPIGEGVDFNKPEMVINGNIYAFNMSDSLKRLLEVTTMYDGKPKYFSFWVRDVRGVGIPGVGGRELTFEELEICHTVTDTDGNPKKDGAGNILWTIDNVFDSESGGSFDYFTLFVNEADINIHYYTWNPLKSTNSTNGYIITAHKGYFFGAETEYKNFFTVNAFENYTFGGNTNEKYYIVGWLKVYDNILTKDGAEPGTLVLDEFNHAYFLNQSRCGMIVDYRTKEILKNLERTNPYLVTDADTSGFLYGLNQQIAVKKRDVVNESLGVINVYMYAVYAKVTYNVNYQEIDSKQQYNAEIFAPNTPEMGNLVGGELENNYQFINYPDTNEGNATATSNVVSYWAKFSSAKYTDLIGVYFEVKDMMNSGALKFTVLTDEAGNPIKNTILPEVVKANLTKGDILVNFYCRTENINVVMNGIEINGAKSEIIAGAKNVGAMTEDGFQFNSFGGTTDLINGDGIYIGIFDGEIIDGEIKNIAITLTGDYSTYYTNALSKLESLKTTDMGEYRLRALLAKTSLQLVKWANTTETNKFVFDENAVDLVFDFSNGETQKLKEEFDKLVNIIDFITKGEKYGGSTEIKLNSASFIRLTYAIASYSFVRASHGSASFESLKISSPAMLAEEMGRVFSIVNDSGEIVYFTGTNTENLSGGSVYLDRLNDTPDPGADYDQQCHDLYQVGDIIKFENASGVYYGLYIGSINNANDSAYVVSANKHRSFELSNAIVAQMYYSGGAFPQKNYIVIQQDTSGDGNVDTVGLTYIRVF